MVERDTVIENRNVTEFFLYRLSNLQCLKICLLYWHLVSFGVQIELNVVSAEADLGDYSGRGSNFSLLKS